MSGVGKGVATASIGALLKARGLKVTAVKVDPYLNVDPGTMNPVEHGEVFVTSDGLEADQDLGNYERFLDEDLNKNSCMTSGSVYLTVINRERALGYGGRTVEAVPHIPLEIISRLKKAAKDADADVTLIEIGGTVGEYQNIMFLEACRMMQIEARKSVFVILVGYLPVLSSVGEMKSKPTQYACRTLNTAGLQPDMIVCRSTHPVDAPRKQKISTSCNVDLEDVISAPDLESIYEVPLKFDKENVTDRIIEKLELVKKPAKMDDWINLNKRIKASKTPVRIGVVGKYFSTGDFVLSDSYLSVLEAIKHACWFVHRKPEIIWLNSEDFEQRPETLEPNLKELDGIIIPGGFGTRGVEGKLETIRYARENKIPYLGLCYGMQLALIEAARNLLGWEDANTYEINPEAKHPVICLMEEQVDKVKGSDYGASMRLGSYPCEVKEGTKAWELYGEPLIHERHRHRYEANPKYRKEMEEKGVVFSGLSPDGKLAEIIEYRDHPFFMASQFHPEFQSRPFHPHPLFLGFIKAAAGIK